MPSVGNPYAVWPRAPSAGLPGIAPSAANRQIGRSAPTLDGAIPASGWNDDMPKSWPRMGHAAPAGGAGGACAAASAASVRHAQAATAAARDARCMPTSHIRYRTGATVCPSPRAGGPSRRGRDRLLEQVHDEGRGPGKVPAADPLARLRVEVLAPAAAAHEVDRRAGEPARVVAEPELLEPAGEQPVGVDPHRAAPVPGRLELGLVRRDRRERAAAAAAAFVPGPHRRRLRGAHQAAVDGPQAGNGLRGHGAAAPEVE